MTVVAVFLAALIGIILNDIYLGYLLRHDEDVYRNIRENQKRLYDIKKEYKTLEEQVIELRKEKMRMEIDKAASCVESCTFPSNRPDIKKYDTDFSDSYKKHFDED